MLPISEVMRHEIASVSPDAPVRRVVEVMVETGVAEVLVVDGRGRVVGSVGDDQLVVSLHASRSRSWWGRLRGDDDGGPERRLSYGVNVMPVVDHGILVGVVFRGDLIKRLLLPYAFARSART